MEKKNCNFLDKMEDEELGQGREKREGFCEVIWMKETWDIKLTFGAKVNN